MSCPVLSCPVFVLYHRFSLSLSPSLVHEPGSKGEGLVYSVTTDVGLYDIGLNIGLCSLLSIFGGSDVITDAVRTASLRFNTYNGQKDGLFSSVDITAKFSLGK